MVDISHICLLRSLSSSRKRIPSSYGESLSLYHRDDHGTSRHFPCYTKNCLSYSLLTVSSSISECWLINPCLDLVSHFCTLIEFSDTMRDHTSGRQAKEAEQKREDCGMSWREEIVLWPERVRASPKKKQLLETYWNLYSTTTKALCFISGKTEVKITSRKYSKVLHDLFPLTLRYPLRRGYKQTGKSRWNVRRSMV